MNTITDNPTAAARRFLHVWTTMLGLTDRPDRPRVEQLVKDAYRAAGLPHPQHIIWCASPLTMAWARSAFPLVADRPVGPSVADQLVHGPMQRARSAVRVKTGELATLCGELERGVFAATIRKNRLHGIELQDKLFAIGTTNMILRGDGKANFRRDSIFEAPLREMRGDRQDASGNWVSGHGFTKVLLNPPYSQAKVKLNRHLSELAFIEKALEFLNPGGRLAAIVPQPAMVGKTSEDKARKASILKSHTLDAVITMNPATFADSGVTPHTVIALFTAGRPHPKDAKVKFVNFENDGRKVQIHRGLTDDGTAASRRKHLLDVLRGDAVDDTRFIVRSEVTAQDEWLHSYFYFNDQPPSLSDFMATVADYLSWQVDMHAHGYGDLVKPTGVESADKAGDE